MISSTGFSQFLDFENFMTHYSMTYLLILFSFSNVTIITAYVKGLG